ncbi:hypothetical protein Hanom_Chr06g00548131 [Helianthus anomalus]
MFLNFTTNLCYFCVPGLNNGALGMHEAWGPQGGQELCFIAPRIIKIKQDVLH